MAITEQITCDICGKLKQAVNHWWLGIFIERDFHLQPWKKDTQGKLHLCGQECLIKAVSSWMQTASGEQSKGSDKP